MDRNPIFHGFSRIVAKGLVVIDEIEKEKEGNEKREEEEISQMAAETDEATVVCKNNNNKMEASLVSYPCSAVNRYECPYEKGKVKEGENANFDVDTLFT